MKLKVFPLDTGGTVRGLVGRIESQGNKLLSENPNLDIVNMVTQTLPNGMTLLLVFYNEGKGNKK